MRVVILIAVAVFVSVIGIVFSFSDSYEQNQEIRDEQLLRETYIGTPGNGRERCENRLTDRDEVECRLKLNIQREDFPEVCEKLDNAEECLGLQLVADMCLGFENSEDTHDCFITSSKNQREYMVLLLNLLDSKVTKKYHNGEITISLATETKLSIMNLQRDLLEGVDKNLIYLDVEKLEEMWD